MPPAKTGARRTGPQAAKAKQQHPTEPSAAESLLFSQFTAMLDLIKPELATAQIDYVELTGATRDRANPISRFQSGVDRAASPAPPIFQKRPSALFISDLTRHKEPDGYRRSVA